MPRINLLPWREEQRKERQKSFAVAAAGAVLMGLLTILIVHLTYERLISHQNARNQLLKDEISLLDLKIAEIEGLERQKERLLARMEIIEQLQKSRPEIVHLFDETTRTIPDGVYLTELKQVAKRLELDGVAESTTRVSAYMRNIDGSDWLTSPGLKVIEHPDRRDGSPGDAEFSLTAMQVTTTDEDGLVEAGAQ